jgi:hypothetical protein
MTAAMNPVFKIGLIGRNPRDFWGLVFILVAFCSLSTGCREKPGWQRDLESGDFSRIECQDLFRGLHPAALSGPDGQLIKAVKTYLAQNEKVLPSIAGKCPGRETAELTGFVFSGVMADDSWRLMLDYFSRYAHPRIMAGRRVQLVFDRARELERILVYELPLE